MAQQWHVFQLNVLQGLDGEATEPITEQLREPAAEEQDPEQQFAVARVLAQPVEQGADSGEPLHDINCFIKLHFVGSRVTAHPEQTADAGTPHSKTALKPFNGTLPRLGVLHTVSKA